MTEDRGIIRAEVGPLGLAKQLGNVAQAGGMMGHGRDSLSRSTELHDRGGAPALREPSRRKPILKDRGSLRGSRRPSFAPAIEHDPPGASSASRTGVRGAA